ncbi:MAG TPA: 5-deoxy-glucuronate isomerase [Bryobacteraceae bacterium]|nr:5-deoxy-glucuronate isomerase [Bryobacteraceae bacterium]
MGLHIKSPGDAPGVYPIVKRGEGLKHLSFTIIELGGALRTHEWETGEEEQSLDSYAGPVRVEVENSSGKWSAEIGARRTLKETGPMIYLPAGSKAKISRLDERARVTAAGAAGKTGASPRLIAGSEIMVTPTGKNNFARTVCTHIADNVDAVHLICGETVSQPGGWTSSPPHKHDRFTAAGEVPMEEVYYFLFEPNQGFGFIRVYTGADDPEPFDHAFVVEHGDTVLIPRGYHPVVACPGYTLNYTWVLAGEGRAYGTWSDDPRHTWIKD